jgi:hypothetical protein
MKASLHSLFAFALLICLVSCKKGFDSTSLSQEEIGRFIAARVPSVIDPGDVVRIRFAVPVDTTQTSGIFSFKPTVDGRTYWEDDRTLAFQPDKSWVPAQNYQLQIQLDKLIKDIDPGMKRVVFDFAVRPVRMTVSFDPLVPSFDGDIPSYLLRGRISTSISIDSTSLEKILSLKSNGKMSALMWQHSGQGKTHDFVVADITSDAKLDFKWDGKPIGSESNGTRSIVIPKSDVLSVLSFEPGSDGERKISVYFSQKLKSSQDLNGLVLINGSSAGFTIRKQDHVLSIYPGEELTGDLSVQLHEKISSSRGFELGQSIPLKVSLDKQLPELKLVF